MRITGEKRCRFSVLNVGILECFLFSLKRSGAGICSCVLKKILVNVLNIFRNDDEFLVSTFMCVVSDFLALLLRFSAAWYVIAVFIFDKVNVFRSTDEFEVSTLSAQGLLFGLQLQLCWI